MLSMFPNLSAPAIELKGSLLTLMVLRLLYPNNERILFQLAEKIAKAPGFFQHAPVVIDLHALHEHEFENSENSEFDQLFDLAEIVRALRSHGLVPVGIRGGNPAQQELALSLNLGILSDSKTVERPRRYSSEESEPVVPTPPLSTSKIVTQPVRSMVNYEW
jgi:septum site-determining protein MinC